MDLLVVALKLCVDGVDLKRFVAMNVAFDRTAVLAGNVKVLASWSV